MILSYIMCDEFIVLKAFLIFYYKKFVSEKITVHVTLSKTISKFHFFFCLCNSNLN